MKINGWTILFFKIFYDQYIQLVKEVQSLSQKEPAKYKNHPKTKLLAKVHNAIKQEVPSNPGDKKYLLGDTLGERYKDWRRVKEGLPPRYRLFFKFRTMNHQIIFAWINDEFTLRKIGSKKDVYSVFRKMLEKQTVPNDFKELLKASQATQ